MKEVNKLNDSIHNETYSNLIERCEKNPEATWRMGRDSVDGLELALTHDDREDDQLVSTDDLLLAMEVENG